MGEGRAKEEGHDGWHGGSHGDRQVGGVAGLTLAMGRERGVAELPKGTMGTREIMALGGDATILWKVIV